MLFGVVFHAASNISATHTHLLPPGHDFVWALLRSTVYLRWPNRVTLWSPSGLVGVWSSVIQIVLDTTQLAVYEDSLWYNLGPKVGLPTRMSSRKARGQQS